MLIPASCTVEIFSSMVECPTWKKKEISGSLTWVTIYSDFFFIFIAVAPIPISVRSSSLNTFIGSQSWSQLKCKPNPGPLVSPSMTKAFGSMFIYGGERNGKPTDELWRFSIGKIGVFCFYSVKFI